MTSSTETLYIPVRRISRFRVVVTSGSPQPKPYTWKIRDEVADRCARRSPDRYRTSKDAWEAGTKVLADWKEAP